MKRGPEPAFREARASDRTAIDALVKRVGFDSSYEPGVAAVEPRSASDADWPRPENPACSFRDPPPPTGWVIEAADRIVGYNGNVAQLFQFGERTLLAAAASGSIVEPEYRGLSFSLMARFFRQPGVDLLLNTTTSPIGGKIFGAFKCAGLPVRDYDQILFWVTGESGFATAVLDRLAVPRALASLARWPLAAALSIDGLRRGPGRTKQPRGLEIDTLPLVALGEEFDELWRRKLEEPPRLMAWRTSAALKWHYHGRDRAGGIHVLCCRRGGELRGYLVLARFDAPGIGLERLRVVDMLVLDDEGDVIDALLAAAFEHGRSLQAHVVELMGFPAAIRRRMLDGRPYVRRLPSWPYFYKARDDETARRLESAEAWYPCPYDGDASL